MLTPEIRYYIDKSVLCWLATVDTNGMPSVSPKEVFTFFGSSELIIANIASPGTIRNLKTNNKVCISFVDVFEQKGYKLKGVAAIIDRKHELFEELFDILLKIAGPDFPIASIIKFNIQSSKEINAPRYLLFPETTIEEQKESAYKIYGVKGPD